MINIAIDGFCGSGKSTLSKELAKRLNFRMLDTGAIFRGLGYVYNKSNLGEMTEKSIHNFLKTTKVEVKFVGDVQNVIVNGENVTAFLRNEEVGQLASKISVFPEVRKMYLAVAKKFATDNDCVMEGRDIGSFVLPNADFKFFCTADENVRAKRRFEQQLALGNQVEFADILNELRERDYKDTHREHGAITVMPDSIIVDTTHQSLEQSVDFCLKEIKKKHPNIKTY